MGFGLSISAKRACIKMAKIIFAKDPVKFIPVLAEALKKIKEIEVPEWAMYAKSGVSRERPPADDDFWYIRMASILRQLYIRGVIGVGKLRTRYGSRKDRGGKPNKFKKSGGKIIRVILQQAEVAGLVEKISRLQHGRRLTQKGKDLLDSIEVEKNEGLDFDNIQIGPVKDIEKKTTEISENKRKKNVKEIREIKTKKKIGSGKK